MNRGLHGAVEIGAGHHDEGIAAAQFEDGLLDPAAGLRGHRDAGRFAAGERGGLDARVVENAFHRRGADQQGLENVRGKAGAADDLFDGERALRHVGGVLEQAHVAGHERRRGEAEHLPEGKIPGHHGEHGADRLVADEGAAGTGVDRLVGQQALAVLGVIAARQSALGGFGARGGDGLAHFERHQAAQAVLLVFQDPRGGGEPAGARGERSAAVGTPGRIGAGESGLDLSRSGGFERP